MNEMTLPSMTYDFKFEPWRFETDHAGVTEAPHNIESLRVNMEETFLFL